VIVETREGNKRGPRLLVDLRNNMVFRYEDDEWVRLKLTGSTTINIIPGEPLPVRDLQGLLEGLVVTGIPYPFRGPHPEGAMRCDCGGVRDEDGFCPRCSDHKCHRCGKALNEGGFCSEPTHNPIPIPASLGKPLEIDESKGYQSWEKKPAPYSVPVPRGTSQRRKK
jgi:hypothetical protein